MAGCGRECGIECSPVSRHPGISHGKQRQLSAPRANCHIRPRPATGFFLPQRSVTALAASKRSLTRSCSKHWFQRRLSSDNDRCSGQYISWTIPCWVSRCFLDSMSVWAVPIRPPIQSPSRFRAACCNRRRSVAPADLGRRHRLQMRLP